VTGAAPGATSPEAGRALVTGASSGIGEATATALAQTGWSVVGAGRDELALARVARQAGLAGIVAGDLTEPGGPEAAVQASLDTLGGLDLVVACAGSGWSGPLAEMSSIDVQVVLDANLGQTVQLARASAAALSSTRGQLILVGSVAGLLGVAHEAAYSAAKAGFAGLADALRSEWRPAGVAVTLVSPGVVDTPFFSRRNRPYQRRRPRPVPVATVVSAILVAAERRPARVIVPRWLAFPVWLHGTAPRLYDRLAARHGD
jgi:short-subunit dehydrogenase